MHYVKTLLFTQGWVLPAIVMAGVIYLAYSVDSQNALARAALFEEKERELSARVGDRLREFSDMMGGARALALATDVVSEANWATFTESLEIVEHIKGIHGMGYMNAQTKTALVDAPIHWSVFRDAGPDIPKQVENEFRAIVKEAVEHSDDFLVIRSHNDFAQLLILRPVIRHDTVVGIVLLAGSLRDLFESFSENNPAMVLGVYEGPSEHASKLIYASPMDAVSDVGLSRSLRRATQLSFGSLALSLHTVATREFGQGAGTLPVFILLAGMLLSGLILISLFYSRKSREYAELIAFERADDLAQSEARLQLLFENAREGICSIDVDGRVNFANRAARSILDLTEAQLLDIHHHDIFPVERESAEQNGECHICHALRFGKHSAERVIQLHRAAAEIEFTADPVFEKDVHIKGAVVIFRDVTQRRQSERELIAANKELEEFSYRTSHDLRSPLRSSIGLLRLVDKSLQKEDIDTVKKALVLADDSLVKLDNLVENILDLTRAKNQSEKQQSFSPTCLIEDALKKMSHLEGYEALSIECVWAFDAEIDTFRSRFEMIVENLISNAIKYQNPEAQCPRLRIETKQCQGRFVLTIEDNGLGFPAEQQGQMFQMFKRFHPRTAFGSGLGMYMIKKGVEILDGDIEFTPMPQGSRFTVSIPIDTDTHSFNNSFGGLTHVSSR